MRLSAPTMALPVVTLFRGVVLDGTMEWKRFLF